MKFSIVTPSFNQLDWLRLCIASVADQVESAASFQTREGKGGCGRVSVQHIVQDAGSEGVEDFAREQGASYFKDGKEVFRGPRGEGCQLADNYSLVIHSGKDQGMYDAINKGLRRSDGEICAYLNSDEQYMPGALAWVANFFSLSPCADVLFGAAIVTKNDGSYVCDRRVTRPTAWHTMVSGNLSFFTSSTFFRKASVVDAGILFDPVWRVCGDAAWALKLLESSVTMHSTNTVLSVFAETGGNLSAAFNPSAAEESSRLAARAPRLVRFGKHAVVACHRVRRWLSGAYRLAPHSYKIYTIDNGSERQSFDVRTPKFRWKLGAQRS